MIARFLSPLLLAVSVGMAAAAEPIAVPNGSFESPSVEFASAAMDSWQKTPQPFWWDPQYSWDQLVGSFVNTSATNTDHIVNCDGAQAAFIFANTGAGVSQDYDSDAAHSFNATFEPGKSYQLTVGLIGGGGGMPAGTLFQLSFYYRDAASNAVTVASASITNSLDLFPNTVTLVDCSVNLPTVVPGDACAGKKMGIALLSPVDYVLQGGYWDVDNVRVSATPFKLVNPALSNGQFTVRLQSGPGERVEVLAAEDPGLPLSQWTSLGTVTNITGSDVLTNAIGGQGRRFYQSRLVR